MPPTSSSPMPPSSELITQFTNVSFLRHHQLITDDLWVRNGRIIDPQQRFWEAHARGETLVAHRVVDGAGLILAPGYIDLQLNGAFGADFSNPNDMDPSMTKSGSEDGVTKVCRGVLDHGVTSIYATIITSSPETYRQLQPLVKRREGSAKRGAHILGLHLEGPFITVPGAHPPALVRGNRPLGGNGVVTNQKDAPPSPSPSPPPSSTPRPRAGSIPAGQVAGLEEVLSVYGKDIMSQVDIITLAPEIEGIEPVIRALSSPPFNIVISAGHSKATYAQSVSAAHQGARLITHLFNAMVSFHHRDPGLIGLIGCTELTKPKEEAEGKEGEEKEKQQMVKPKAVKPSEQRIEANHTRGAPPSSSSAPTSLSHPPPASLFYSLIVDGHHTHPASVKIAYSTHPSGAILVTDAMCAMGLQDGRYRFGEIDVDIKGETAHVAGTNTLAGSIATMEKCVQNFRTFTGCTVVEAIEAATLHPAQCMGLRTKGSLDVGMDADLIFLDKDLKVQGCWVMGEMAWKSEQIKITEMTSSAQ